MRARRRRARLAEAAQVEATGPAGPALLASPSAAHQHVVQLDEHVAATASQQVAWAAEAEAAVAHDGGAALEVG